MKNQELLLFEKSGELFRKYGVKSLTMDEIAKTLGISKKTIYQFVENKAELVHKIMQNDLANQRVEVESILKTSGNSVEEMIGLISYFFDQAHEFDSTALYDIHKYYPETWAMYSDYCYNYLVGKIYENLRSGVAQGLYRTDLNADVISKIYMGAIDRLSDQNLFPAQRYAFINTYREFAHLYLRGVVTPAGLKYLEQNNLFKK